MLQTYSNQRLPLGETQPARVMDNNDPLKIGRVRAQFPWQEEKNQKTPWIRLIQPHSGAGKGFYFIPEIGEEVLVGFESQNAEKPFVMGTHYNGSETSSYHTSENDKKVIHTRSGTKIILNDAEGSIFIEDPSGNTYLMDGNGNINVNAPKNMTFTVGENLNINVGMNMTTSVGLNKSDSIGMNNVESVGAMKMTSVVGNASVFITGKLTEVIDGDVHSETKQERQERSGGKTISQSEDHTELHSQTQVHNNSAEKSQSH